jgi:hypothetical protein
MTDLNGLFIRTCRSTMNGMKSNFGSTDLVATKGSEVSKYDSMMASTLDLQPQRRPIMLQHCRLVRERIHVYKQSIIAPRREDTANTGGLALRIASFSDGLGRGFDRKIAPPGLPQFWTLSCNGWSTTRPQLAHKPARKIRAASQSLTLFVPRCRYGR